LFVGWSEDGGGDNKIFTKKGSSFAGMYYDLAVIRMAFTNSRSSGKIRNGAQVLAKGGARSRGCDSSSSLGRNEYRVRENPWLSKPPFIPYREKNTSGRFFDVRGSRHCKGPTLSRIELDMGGSGKAAGKKSA